MGDNGIPCLFESFQLFRSEQNKKVKLLSGGERNRLHLAMTLKEQGNVLLDEPTNDLDVNRATGFRRGFRKLCWMRGCYQSRPLVFRSICTHILAFEGNSEVYFYEGSFSEYEANKRQRLGGDMPKRIKYKGDSLKDYLIFKGCSIFSESVFLLCLFYK